MGGVLWGAIAEWWGTTTAFTVAAAGLAATVPVARRFLPLAAAALDPCGTCPSHRRCPSLAPGG